ncbi:hypothetical protein [Micromonospora echinofusca]|uniref:Tryptophan-associated transmembrane protein (Trp_oprn_chp) n=1 Tax=Micromonospora echinofusca TaxID=47858 RepID=A0ABS3VYK7_MICEH|nr:hypothetical protein [Micromonospora echinofusca]MBO4209624.1 hypothetical protein [Micromonospora echinofusca]
MRTRVALVLVGLALLGYGIRLLAGTARTPGQAVALGTWLLAGLLLPVLVLPLVGGVGLLVARTLPRPLRTTVAVGAGTSGLLLLVAVPGLAAPTAGVTWGGLLAFLGVFWALLLGATQSRIARDQRRGRW